MKEREEMEWEENLLKIHKGHCNTEERQSELFYLSHKRPVSLCRRLNFKLKTK